SASDSLRMPSLPSARSFQNSSRSRAPGKRAVIPTIAIASPLFLSAASVRIACCPEGLGHEQQMLALLGSVIALAGSRLRSAVRTGAHTTQIAGATANRGIFEERYGGKLLSNQPYHPLIRGIQPHRVTTHFKEVVRRPNGSGSENLAPDREYLSF